MQTTTRLEDFGECDFVIEAATENIPLKREIFQTLDQVTRKETILASNTSSISITRIASFTGRPEKVIGMHFFNPAPVMKLIELIRGMATSEATFQLAERSRLKMGKTRLKPRIFPGLFPAALFSVS